MMDRTVYWICRYAAFGICMLLISPIMLLFWIGLGVRHFHRAIAFEADVRELMRKNKCKYDDAHFELSDGRKSPWDFE